MRLTVKDLKRIFNWVEDAPEDDWEVWIEYPERYGLAQPVEIISYYTEDQNDIIRAMSYCVDKKNKRFTILHHY